MRVPLRLWSGICVLLVALSVAGGCSLGGDGDEVNRVPSGEDVVLDESQAGAAGSTKTATDEAGSITFKVPDSWDTTVEWAGSRFVTDVLASTDADAFNNESWEVPGIGVTLSRTLAEAASTTPNIATLSGLLNQIITRSSFERQCDDRRSSTITPTGSDLLSLTVGKYFEIGVADAFTGCGGSDTAFTDLVALNTEERIIVYMQVQVPSPEDQGDVDGALQTLSFDLDRVPGAPSEGGPTPAPPAEKHPVTGPLDEDALGQLIPASLGGASHTGVSTSFYGRVGSIAAVETSYPIAGRKVNLYVYAYSSPQSATAVLDKDDQHPNEAFEAVQEGPVNAGGKNVGKWRLLISAGSAYFYPGTMVVWTNGAVLSRLEIYATRSVGDQARNDEALALFRETPF